MRLLFLIFILLELSLAWADDTEATSPAPQTPPPTKTEETAPASSDTDIFNIEADVTEGVYKQDEQVLILTGHVKVVHGQTTLTCDKATAREADKIIIAEGNVKVVDSKNSMTLTCGYGEYYRDRKYVVAMKGPVLTSTKNGQRPLVITADLMEMYTDDNRGIATGSVHVVSEQTNATGAMAVYFGKQDKIELTGEPVAWERDSRLVGRKMTLILRNQKVEEALVEEDVRLLFYSAKSKKKDSPEDAKKRKLAEAQKAGKTVEIPPEDKADEIKPGFKKAESKAEDTPTTYNGKLEAVGNLLHAYIRDDAIRVAYVEGAARGVYFPFDDLGKQTGENMTVDGQRLTAYFSSGAVDSVVVEDDATAVYLPASGDEGKTITNGQVISMYVIDGKVDRILVRGDAKGSYFGKPQNPTADDKKEGEKTQ